MTQPLFYLHIYVCCKQSETVQLKHVCSWLQPGQPCKTGLVPLWEVTSNLWWWFRHTAMCSPLADFWVVPIHNIHAILLLTDMCCNLFENERLQHVRASKLWVWEVWEKKNDIEKLQCKKKNPLPRAWPFIPVFIETLLLFPLKAVAVIHLW